MSAESSEIYKPRTNEDNLYVQAGGTWTILASGLTKSADGGLETSEANLDKLASAGVVSRSSQGNYQLHLRLDAEAEVDVDPVVKAGTTVKALVQDSLQQSIGQAPLDTAVVNALAQSPASPQGTISSPFITSDAAAKLIFTMSEIFTTESRVRKYTDELYTNLINQQFIQSYTQQSLINQRFDAEQHRLLGALAGANMALIGAIVSGAISFAAAGLSFVGNLSSRRSGVDADLTVDNPQKDRALRTQTNGGGKDNPALADSANSLNPQKIDTHLDPARRGENTQSGAEATRVPRSTPGVEEAEAAAAAQEAKRVAGVQREREALQASDTQLASQKTQHQSVSERLTSLDLQLKESKTQQDKLKSQRTELSESIKGQQDELSRIRGERQTVEGNIDAMSDRLEQLHSKRNSDRKLRNDLQTESDRLKQELDGLPQTDLTPSALSEKLRVVERQKGEALREQGDVDGKLAEVKSQVAQLDRDRAVLSREQADRESDVAQLENQGKALSERIERLKSQLGALDAKTGALLDEKPSLTKIFSRGGAEPSATLIDSNSVSFNALKSAGPGGPKFADKLASAHGRSVGDTTVEYKNWHAGVEAFLKKHGGPTRASQGEAISEFNAAWTRGVDLNKVSERLSTFGEIRSPKQMRGELDRLNGEHADLDSKLGAANASRSDAVAALAQHDRDSQTARSALETLEAQRAKLKGAIDGADRDISELKQQRQNLEELLAKRAELGDRYDAKQEEFERANAAAETSEQSYNDTHKSYTGLTQERDQLLSESDGVNKKIHSLQSLEREVAETQATIDANMESDSIKLEKLKTDKAKLDGEIQTSMQKVDAAQAALKAAEAVPPVVAPAPKVEAPNVDGSKAATTGTESKSTDETKAAAKAESSAFMRGLQRFLEISSQPSFTLIMNNVGMQAGNILRQMGQIYRAQAAIEANNSLIEIKTAEAYLETTKELFDQLIAELGSDSKAIDKQMHNLLEVIKSIAATDAANTRALFRG